MNALRSTNAPEMYFSASLTSCIWCKRAIKILRYHICTRWIEELRAWTSPRAPIVIFNTFFTCIIGCQWNGALVSLINCIRASSRCVDTCTWSRAPCKYGSTSCTIRIITCWKSRAIILFWNYKTTCCRSSCCTCLSILAPIIELGTKTACIESSHWTIFQSWYKAASARCSRRLLAWTSWCTPVVCNSAIIAISIQSHIYGTILLTND